MIDNPYQQYMYSYPHKTAYEYIKQLPVEEYQNKLSKYNTMLYFHIPFCETKCGYCNLFSIPEHNNQRFDAYINAIQRHSDQYRKLLDFKDVSFESLIFGGGTPLILSIDQLETLFSLAEKDFHMDLNQVHIGIETSPNQASYEKLIYLKSKGTDRISIGVQSFVDKELKQLKRNHFIKDIKMALKNIQRVGFKFFNIDLIYGIPSQSIGSVQYSLESALEYEPTEIFIYPLYQKPYTGIYNQFEIDQQLQYKVYLYICRRLEDVGYFQTSMRRFVKSKPLKESSCGFDNVISLGCGGRSYIGNLHFCEPYTSKQAKCRASLDHYIQRKTFFDKISFYKLNENEIKRRYVIKNLLHYTGISFLDYTKNFAASLYDDFPILKTFVKKGWGINFLQRFRLTQLGMSLSDYIGPMLISESVQKNMEDFCDD